MTWYKLNLVSQSSHFLCRQQGERETPDKSKKGQIRLVVEKRSHFLVHTFLFLFPQSLKSILIVHSIVVELYCVGRICHIIKGLMVLGYACYKQLFIVVRCLVRRSPMHAQLFNWNQIFLGSNFEIFQNLFAHVPL